MVTDTLLHSINKAIIIGSGRMGAALALLLSNENKNVTIVDKENIAFKKLSKAYAGNTFVGDGMDTAVLEELDIKDCDLILAATESDNTNIFISMVAKNIYKTKYVFSRLYDDERAIIFEDTNIQAICPPKLSIDAFKNVFLKGGELDENLNH